MGSRLIFGRLWAAQKLTGGGILTPWVPPFLLWPPDLSDSDCCEFNLIFLFCPQAHTKGLRWQKWAGRVGNPGARGHLQKGWWPTLLGWCAPRGS